VFFLSHPPVNYSAPYGALSPVMSWVLCIASTPASLVQGPPPSQLISNTFVPLCGETAPRERLHLPGPWPLRLLWTHQDPPSTPRQPKVLAMLRFTSLPHSGIPRARCAGGQLTEGPSSVQGDSWKCYEDVKQGAFSPPTGTVATRGAAKPCP